MLYPTLPSSEDIAEQIMPSSLQLPGYTKSGILIAEATACFSSGSLQCNVNSVRRGSIRLSQVPVYVPALAAAFVTFAFCLS